jgi:nucleoside-diphosphate-sugar epimerase
MSKIFATGTSGTIGKHFGSRVSKIAIDLENMEKSFTIPDLESKDSILHTAGIVGSINVSAIPDKSHAINVVGSSKLAKYARDKNINRFVFVSSAHVYTSSDLILDENSSIGPITMYAKQKLEAERNIIKIFEGVQEKLCIVRIFSVLDWDVSDFTLGGAIKQLTELNSQSILRNIDDVRDFLTPNQVANALIAIVNEPSLAVIVNLCSGVGTSVLNATQKMCESSGVKFPAERMMKGNSDNPYMVGSNLKLTSHIPGLDLNWTPSNFSNL